MTRTLPLSLLVLVALSSLAPAAHAKRIGISASGVPVKDLIGALPETRGLAPSDVVDITDVYERLTQRLFFDFRSPRPSGWPSELDADWDTGTAACAAFGGDEDGIIVDPEARPCGLELAPALLQRFLDFTKIDEVIAVRVVEETKTKTFIAIATRFAARATTMTEGVARTGDKRTLALSAIREAGAAGATAIARSTKREFPQGPPADTPELHAGVPKYTLPVVDVGEPCARARITLDIEPASAPVAATTRTLYAKSLRTEGDASVAAVRCTVRYWQVKNNPLGKMTRMQSYRATVSCDDTPRVAAAGLGISSEHALQSVAPVLVQKLVAARCQAK